MAASRIHSTNYLHTRDTSLHPWKHPCTSGVGSKSISLCASLPPLNIGRGNQHARNGIHMFTKGFLLHYMRFIKNLDAAGLHRLRRLRGDTGAVTY